MADDKETVDIRGSAHGSTIKRYVGSNDCLACIFVDDGTGDICSIT